MDIDAIKLALSKKFKQKPWDCPHCNQHFEGYRELAKHGRDHGITTRQQRLDGKMGDLVAYYLNVTTNRPTPNGKGQYKCPECNNLFNDCRHLGIHRSQEHGHIGSVQMSRVAQPNFKSPNERQIEKKPRKSVSVLQKLTDTVESFKPEIILPEAFENHRCDATQVLDTVHRSLATLNLLMAMQNMSIEQIVALSGTIGALGNMAKR